MSISDLLGAMMQSGMAPSSSQRLQNALGGGSGGLLESLGGLLGGTAKADSKILGAPFLEERPAKKARPLCPSHS